MALALWAGFVGLLALAGALDRLGSDVAWLAAFACGFSALAYAADAELRLAVETRGIASLWTGFIVSLAACAVHVAAMLAFAPAAVLLAAALAFRALAPRLSSTAAASPGARRGAL